MSGFIESQCSISGVEEDGSVALQDRSCANRPDFEKARHIATTTGTFRSFTSPRPLCRSKPRAYPPNRDNDVFRLRFRYGILFHDIVPIEDIQPQIGAPIATPRQPLKPRNTNVPATPPPSDRGKHKNAFTACLKTSAIAGSQSRLDKYRSQPSASAPAVPSTRLRQHAPPQQKPPSSSQPLPTPLITRAVPSNTYAPPSSQPTPSRRSIEPRLSQIPAMTPFPRVNRQPTTTISPTRCQRNSDAPLYRFPFGARKCKTLLDVPENYNAYLRVDQDMADSMPGLAVVLRLYDAGQLAIAPQA